MIIKTIVHYNGDYYGSSEYWHDPNYAVQDYHNAAYWRKLSPDAVKTLESVYGTLIQTVGEYRIVNYDLETKTQLDISPIDILTIKGWGLVARDMIWNPSKNRLTLKQNFTISTYLIKQVTRVLSSEFKIVRVTKRNAPENPRVKVVKNESTGRRELIPVDPYKPRYSYLTITLVK